MDLDFDSPRPVLVSSLYSGLNCITKNIQTSAQLYQMSKKLWQAIGKQIQPQAQPQPHQQQPKSQASKNAANHKTHPLFPSFSSSSSSSSSRNQPIRLPSSEQGQVDEIQGDMSIEFESCLSEQLQSQPSNHSIPYAPSKPLLQKTLKIRTIFIQEQVSLLKLQLESLKKATLEQARELSENLASAGNKIYNQFINWAYQTTMQVCQRCQNSKNMVDLLTRQCWELDAKLKQKIDDYSKQQEHHIVAENPIKKIEASLLQQRAETIKRLKIEVEQTRNEAKKLREENESVRLQLQGKEDQLRDMESQYRSSLFSFKGEIDVINQAYCSKIQCILQEKSAAESEYRILQEKYIALQQICQQDHLKRSDKRFLTQYPQANTTYSSSTTQLSLPVSQQYPSRGIPSHNITSLIDIEPLSITHIPRQSTCRPSFNQTPTKHSPSSQLYFPSKNRLETILKSKQWAENTAESRNTHNASATCFNSALQKLAELQKDVRKEINRSKNSYK